MAAYERVLAELGVDVKQSLQAGLTDQDLDALEQQYSCKFSRDIRWLYKWHNGTPDSVSVEIFPLGKFMPLDQTLEQMNRPTEDSLDSDARQFMDEWLAFRKSWIEITADGSGNGHYYDPERIDQSSSFFYHAHDDVPYDFYPWLGNRIQSILDLHSQERLVYSDGWIQVTGLDSYQEEMLLFERYGRRVE